MTTSASSSLPRPASRDANFDCNICLDPASDPVVTRCGHLYCWRCLASWLTRQSDCPVCKGAVRVHECVPLYGRGRERGHLPPHAFHHDHPSTDPGSSRHGENNADNAEAPPVHEDRPQGFRRPPIRQRFRPEIFGGWGDENGLGRPLHGGLAGFTFFFLPSVSWLSFLLLLGLGWQYYVRHRAGRMHRGWIVAGMVLAFLLLMCLIWLTEFDE